MRLHTFRQNTTLCWSCLLGDYIIWMRMKGAFSADGKWDIVDLWSAVSGDTVTVTNVWDDLPSWFTLHPLETANTFVPRMGKMLAGGYRPTEPIEGPGLWRVRSGDRLVRVGADRLDAGGKDGVLDIVSFDYSALAYGERGAESDELVFGSCREGVPQSEKDRFRAGFLAGVCEGPPRSMETTWRLG